ncbi:MAG: sulfurtransferase TusA family protein [Guyparkeria sp.]|uniref:sulfurtransferase TusA family protein n=1 Tax=Guyparkeria sp. TaxID=2035736 RepID=UPI00397B5B5A
MSEDMPIEVDARGLSCPMPLLKARKALATAAVGQRLVVIATDRGAESDFRAYCERAGHELISMEWRGDELRVELARGE